MTKKTNNGQRKSLLTGASLLAAAAAAMSAAPAMAQQAGDDEEEAIVVTGSRIARTDATSSSPLTVLDAEEIQDAGVIGIGEILRRDPAIGSGGFGQSNILSGGGAQTVDLRNLGPNRTLVLINGQRYSLFTDSLQNEGQDLGLLPAAMIQRVEILRDGASTAYGADAVAGVVNFILRDDYDGLFVSALAGTSDEGDANTGRVSFLAGASNDRGSATIAMEWVARDALPQTNRDWAAFPLGAGANNTPFASIGSSIGGPRLLTPGGTTVECFGTFGSGSLGTGPCARYNYAVDQDLTSSLDGYNIAFNGHYEITDNIEWHGTAVYGSRFSEFGLAANPISGNAPTGPYLTGIRIGAAEVNNPYGQQLSLTWRPVEYGNRQQTFDADQIWLSTGLSGTVADDYSWDVTLTRSEVGSNGQTAVVPNVVRLSRLLNSSQCLADPVCNSPAIGPVANIRNLFTGATPLSVGQQNYAFYVQSTNSRFVTEAAIGTLSGPLFELPAGDLSFAAGIEFRQESGKATPDSVTQGGESVANATFPTAGHYDVFEVFGEFDIPLLADAPLAQELTLNLQGRHSDFSNFGGADTWKAGLVWAPVEDLRVRASMGTSFRAPNVTDLYSIGVQSFNGLLDPCTTDAPGAAGPSDGVVDDTAAAPTCAALAVNATYIQPASQLRVLSGGNPNLQPETGETWTVGAVFQPSFFTPLTVTVDYWHIDLDNAIAGGALQTRLNNCYRASPVNVAAFSDPSSQCFGLADRTAGGVPTNLVSISQNAAGTSETSGVDFSVLLNFDDVGPGDLSLGVRGTWLENADGNLFCGPGDCTGFLDGNTSGGNGYPEWRLVFDAEYETGPWDFEWQSRYMSDLLDPNCPSSACTPTNPLGPYVGTPEYWLHDARVKFSHDNYQLTVGVNNIADEDPPYAIVTGTNTYPALFDVIGRSFFVGVSADF